MNGDFKSPSAWDVRHESTRHLNFLSDEKDGHCAVSSKAAEALSAHDFFQKDVLLGRGWNLFLGM